jgi:hypothetical protein
MPTLTRSAVSSWTRAEFTEVKDDDDDKKSA